MSTEEVEDLAGSARIRNRFSGIGVMGARSTLRSTKRTTERTLRAPHARHASHTGFAGTVQGRTRVWGDGCV